MIRAILMRLVQIFEFLKNEDLGSFVREVIYINRKAILIEKNLFKVNHIKKFLQQSNIKFEEVTEDTFNDKNYKFAFKNRYLKAVHYLKKGYGGHVILKGDEVIGDIWYSATSKYDKASVHPDVHRFGIKPSEDNVYSFDQFVVPTERGNSVAAALVNFQLCSLREKGYSKVYGYYWADNFPAVWNNRVMNKYKEIRTLRVNGCWFFKKISSIDEQSNRKLKY